MVSFKNLVLGLLIPRTNAVAEGGIPSADSPRRLALELIAGYEPQTVVTDQNALDLDQKVMEVELSFKKVTSFENARFVYTEGGFSNSYAVLHLLSPLVSRINHSTPVTGYGEDHVSPVYGYTFGIHEEKATTLKVVYHVSEIQASYVRCQVGALPRINKANLAGCFMPGGNITVASKSYKYNYTNGIRKGNKNDRTLQSLSKNAANEMLKCNTCPYRTFNKFYKYYGSATFGDDWIEAAFASNATEFTLGNADFSYVDFSARQHAIAKGTVFLNVYHYVILKLEQALDGCELTSGRPVHAWDEAVAFYTGSLEESEGQGAGHLLHALADSNCRSFKTCGSEGIANQGHSKINIDIFRELKKGQLLLAKKECGEVRGIKERIEALMTVPMIQGALRYAYDRGELLGSETAEAEGAAFSAAVLPLIHDCNPTNADVIYRALAIGSDRPAFSDVKGAFENNYRCLGITCADVGGYWDDGNQKYFVGAEPCGDNGAKTRNIGATIGSILGLLSVTLIVGLVFVRRRTAKVDPPPIHSASESVSDGVQDADKDMMTVDVI